ncbi:MAG TPA: hypothetical protein VMA86_02775 [Acetobacteraceae bacterium]|nr:hypothetical protein [Acetobacteraceae bacterium]
MILSVPRRERSPNGRVRGADMVGFITRFFSRPANGSGKRRRGAEAPGTAAERAAAEAAPETVVPETAAKAEAAAGRAPVLKAFRWGPESGHTVDAIIFLCHGMGSNGEHIIQIAPQLGAVVKRALFVAPNAPNAAEHGGDGRAWFDMRDRRPAALAVGVRRARVALDALIDAELERVGLPADAYALAGYSQGAMTALFTGLRREPGPRAIFCYAGALIAPETLGEELRNRAPVMLAHGLADTVVPAFYSRDAERALRAAGVPVQGAYLPGAGHNIDGAGLQAGKRFLRRWLVPEAEETGFGMRRSLADG